MDCLAGNNICASVFGVWVCWCVGVLVCWCVGVLGVLGVRLVARGYVACFRAVFIDD